MEDGIVITSNDKKLFKKINKICKKYSKGLSLDELENLIVKEFGSISFSIPNRNLLHLVIDYCPDDFDPLFLLIDLMKVGVNPNFINENGENFFQTYCQRVSSKIVYHNFYDIQKYIDVNHRDNSGKTIMHTLLMISNNELEDAFFNYDTSFVRFYYTQTLKELIKMGFNEIGPCDGSKFDIFELLEQKLIELAKLDYPRKDLSNLYSESIIDIKTMFYLKNPKVFTDLLTDDIYENKKIYYDIFNYNKNFLNSDILVRVQQEEYSEKDSLVATKRLIELGCDVNVCSGSMNDIGCYINENLIDTAINFGHSGEYIISLVEIALKNGLDLNNMQDSPIKTMLGKDSYNINDLATVYSWLSMYGYNGLSDDVNAYSYPYEGYGVNSNEELIYLIRKNGFNLIFSTILLEAGLLKDDSWDDNFVSLMLDSVDSLSKLDNSYNDFYVCRKIVENISNDRKDNVVFYNKVTTEDILNELANVFSKLLNSKFNKTLVKRGD